jgi:hypothetical protein
VLLALAFKFYVQGNKAVLMKEDIATEICPDVRRTIFLL